MERRKDLKGKVLEKGENQRKDGTYMFRYTDSMGKRRTIYNKDLSKLRDAEKRIRRDLEDGISLELDRTLNEQFVDFCALNANLAVGTMNNYKGFWKTHVQDTPLGNKKLKCLRASDGQKLINALVDSGLKSSTVIVYYRMLKRCVDSAVADGIIRFNPFRCETLPEEDIAEKAALTTEQREIFFNFIRGSRHYSKYEPLFTIMLETGIRNGEVCGLTWDDVDLKNRMLRVDHQLQYIKIGDQYQYYAKTPKTQKGKRMIPLTKKAVKAFADQKALQFGKGERSEEKIGEYKDFVFTSKNKLPYRSTFIDCVLRSICSGINRADPNCHFPKISAHTLRHTACTRMVKSKMELKAIQKVLGHADISTTLNIYTHISQDEIASEMEKFEDCEGF